MYMENTSAFVFLIEKLLSLKDRKKKTIHFWTKRQSKRQIQRLYSNKYFHSFFWPRVTKRKRNWKEKETEIFVIKYGKNVEIPTRMHKGDPNPLKNVHSNGEQTHLFRFFAGKMKSDFFLHFILTYLERIKKDFQNICKYLCVCGVQETPALNEKITKIYI